MRITILANRDLHSNIALNLLLPTLSQHRFTIFLSDAVGAPSQGYQPPKSLQEMRFFEQELFKNTIEALIELQPQSGNRYLSFKELSELAEQPIRTCRNINKEQEHEAFRRSAPDLVLSIRFGSILREPAISVPPLGVINLHSGLLPDYRGILTTLHSLANQETEVGCTLHYIDSPAIDTGAIIDQKLITVDRTKSLLWHVVQLYPAGCSMMSNAVEDLAAGKNISSKAQGASSKSYFSLPTSEDFERLSQAGFRVWDPEDISTLYQLFLGKQ
ncbi:formyl transferase [Congregibacter brevis]|uniref:Formyl transferase n=1 Tax=Congregibacter brevis TaxID=3081201 RepID=A0ABZ0I9E6_9GAMM|nr:formyl transferase [Congregibacter sp. IMCC45268]